jgi:hypothetical protein
VAIGCGDHAESCPGRIGPISLGMKRMGERSAGNPHAAFDVEGAGDVAWSRCWDTRRRKGETTGNPNFDLNRRASPRPYLREAGGEIPPAYSPLILPDRLVRPAQGASVRACGGPVPGRSRLPGARRNRRRQAAGRSVRPNGSPPACRRQAPRPETPAMPRPRRRALRSRSARRSRRSGAPARSTSANPRPSRPVAPAPG